MAGCSTRSTRRSEAAHRSARLPRDRLGGDLILQAVDEPVRIYGRQGSRRVQLGQLRCAQHDVRCTQVVVELGLIYTADLFAAREVAAGELEAVLEEFLPTSPGLFLYFPARTQTQPKLRAFIDTMTASKRRDTGRASPAGRASARRSRR